MYCPYIHLTTFQYVCHHCLDFLFSVHPCEEESRIRRRVQPRELDNVADASLLAGVDERTFSLQHPLIGGRDHKSAVYAIQCNSECLRPKHVALHHLHCRERLERTCPCATPDQRPPRALT